VTGPFRDADPDGARFGRGELQGGELPQQGRMARKGEATLLHQQLHRSDLAAIEFLREASLALLLGVAAGPRS
jgi:hypothetical protein